MKVFLMILFGFLIGATTVLCYSYWDNKSSKSTYPYSFPEEGSVHIRYVGEGKAITVYEDNLEKFLKVVEEQKLPLPDLNNTIIKRDFNRADHHIISYTYAGDNILNE